MIDMNLDDPQILKIKQDVRNLLPRIIKENEYVIPVMHTFSHDFDDGREFYIDSCFVNVNDDGTYSVEHGPVEISKMNSYEIVNYSDLPKGVLYDELIFHFDL